MKEERLPQEMLEEQVRAACERGDHQAAATALLEEIGSKVYAFLLQRVGNPSEACEVFSMFCEDLWRGLPGFGWRCTVRGWAFAVARHAADRHAKQAGARRRRNVPMSYAPLSQLPQQIRERTQFYLRTEAKTQLRALLQRLPADDRALLQLRLDQKLSWRDIALALEYEGEIPADGALVRSEAKLRQRYQLVKRRLRQWAEEDGLHVEG